jgi:hypothetical protein
MNPTEERAWIKSLPPLPARWKPETSINTTGDWFCPACNIQIAHTRAARGLELSEYGHSPYILELPGYTFNDAAEAIRPKRKRVWQTAAAKHTLDLFHRKVEMGKPISESLEVAAGRAAQSSMIVKNKPPGTYSGDEGATGYSNQLKITEKKLPENGLIVHCHRCARRVKIKSIRGSKKP